MQERLGKLHAYMESNKLDALLITHPKNVYYFTGFLSEPHERFMGLVLVRGESPFLFVPLLDGDKAQEACQSQSLPIYTHDDSQDALTVLQHLLPTPLSHIGVEKNHLTAKTYEALVAMVHATEAVDVGELLCNIRVEKDETEIATIKRAIWVMEESLRRTLPLICVGMTELDVVAELEYQMKKLKAQGPSFSTIVLAGERAALPHGDPGNRVIQAGEVLLIDAGVYVDGYVSDLTRTFAVGQLRADLLDMYDTVLQANLAGIQAVRPGAPIADVDLAARAVIADRGYGEFFINRVGHGIGLELHEAPYVHSQAAGELIPGMVFTIEPGIYNKKIGGIRIEDNVLVTKDGVEVLTSFPKELQTIGE
ncbi:M24 family metallopeptidase [Brevibacillus sp. 179-C9.3 HS]|uniref:M24 family metallopeptidase n=1 Tax=unclassified Brevibacillus TaxID=2684853 RepID=UPI0039A093E6